MKTRCLQRNSVSTEMSATLHAVTTLLIRTHLIRTIRF
jgi:hypothetical protein